MNRVKIISSLPRTDTPNLATRSVLASERRSHIESSIARHSGFLRSVPASAELTVNAVTTTAGLIALRPEYERLQLLARNTLPFALHEWHLTWCEQFLNIDQPLKAQPMIFTMHQSSGSCVAIVPMILTRRRVGPFVFGALDMLGPDPALTEIRTPLIEPGFEARVAKALQRQVRAMGHWDWIRWSGMASAFAQVLEADPAIQWRAPLLSYVLDLPASWELFHAGLKRNIRESLRHCYNSLKRDKLEFRLLVAQEPRAVKESIDRFLELHVKRARLEGTVPHEDHFAGESLRRFLYAVGERLAERGAVRVFELMIGEQVVAARIGFVVGDSLYLYYSGFDPDWAKYSVMTTTLAESIKYAIGQGLATINLSTGTDVSKTRWGPRVVPYGEAVQIAPPLASRLAYAIYQRARNCQPMQSWLGRLVRLGKRNWS